MAAPIRTCYLFGLYASLLKNNLRHYARRRKVDTRIKISPSEDVLRLKNLSKIENPKKNAFVTYNPNDPVQRSILEFAGQPKKNVQSLKEHKQDSLLQHYTQKDLSKASATLNQQTDSDMKFQKGSKYETRLNPIKTIKTDLGESTQKKTNLKVDKHVNAQKLNETLNQSTHKMIQKGSKSEAGMNPIKTMTTDLGVATRKKKDFEGVKQVNAQKLKETRPKKVALNEENLIKFTWLEKGDKTLSSLLVHAKSKQGREQGEIVIEGKKTVLQALSLGLKIKCLFFSGIDKLDFLNHVDFKDVSVYKTSFKNLRVWTELSEPEGFIGIFQKPKDGEVLQPLKTVHPVTLICDRVMDPARLTALLKEAVSTGCDQFITIKGSYNVWHASILMNSELGALKVPTFCDVPWTKLTALLPTTTNLQVFITDTKTLNEDEQNFLKGNIAVVDRIEELTEREMELSDNELEDESENDEEDDHYIPEPLQEKKRPFKVLRQSSILDDLPEDSSFSDKKIMNLYKQAPLNIIERSEMKVSDGKHVVLIVCGENGVPKEARKFVYDMYGEYVEHSELDVSAGQTGHSTLLDIVEQMKNED